MRRRGMPILHWHWIGYERFAAYSTSDVLVDPAAAAAGEKITQAEHPIQGGGYSMPDLAFLKNVPVDGYLQVSGGEARQTARLLARSEGIFGDFSSGANVAAALRLLSSVALGNTVAVVICGSGLKYLSTDIWG